MTDRLLTEQEANSAENRAKLEKLGFDGQDMPKNWENFTRAKFTEKDFETIGRGQGYEVEEAMRQGRPTTLTAWTLDAAVEQQQREQRAIKALKHFGYKGRNHSLGDDIKEFQRAQNEVFGEDPHRSLDVSGRLDPRTVGRLNEMTDNMENACRAAGNVLNASGTCVAPETAHNTNSNSGASKGAVRGGI